MSNKIRPEVSVEQLNDMQRYLGEETIEDYQTGQMSRRRMLRRLVLICGSAPAAAALLAACGDASPTAGSAATTQAATTAASTSPAMTTSAAMTSAAATSPAMTSAATTAAASTTTTVASGTTAPAGAGGGQNATPGPAKSPLSVPEGDPAVQTSSITTTGTGQPVLVYMAQPKGAGPFPGVIVIHENRGLTDHIKDVARRLAKAGYLALAPDLASRAGGTAKLPTDNVTGYFANAKPEDLVADLNSTLTTLDSQTAVKKGKYGVVGFCFGGGYTLRFAAANPKVAAAVSYYGPVPTPVSQMTATQAAILGQYGALDSRVNAGIPDLAKTLKDASKTFEQKVYDGANHAFNNDTGASYNEAASLTAWKETLGWFEKYLK